MRARAFWFLAVSATACGRVGFDDQAHGDASADDARIDGSSATHDASIDAPVDAPPQGFAEVQSAANTVNSGAKSIGVSLTMPVQAGNLIVLAFDFDQSNVATVASMTDTVGTTYAMAGSMIANNVLAYGIAPAGGMVTSTVTLSATSGTYFELRSVVMSGVALTNPLDATASRSGTAKGTDAVSSGPLTTTGANELLFAFEDGSATVVPGTGFTSANTFDADLSEFRTLAAPGTYAATETSSNGGSWTVIAAAFRGR